MSTVIVNLKRKTPDFTAIITHDAHSYNIHVGNVYISGDTKFGFFFTLPPYHDILMTLWSDPSLPLMTGDT